MGTTQTHLPKVIFKQRAGDDTLAICVPTRMTSAPEFWFGFMRLIPPLNFHTVHHVQKAAMRLAGAPGPPDAPDLPAEARNHLLEMCLARGYKYALFLDDDVLVPDLTLIRLTALARLHPDAAAITGVVPIKLEPPEPMLYQDWTRTGAWWDWRLGDFQPVHSAGAGCLFVNLDYVRRLEPPWFQDTYTAGVRTDGTPSRDYWGHDRHFCARLREEAGGQVYADLGLLCGHFDVSQQRVYLLPPEAPCFQAPPVRDAVVPALRDDGVMVWRLLQPPADGRFLGWLESQGAGSQTHTAQLVEVPA